MSSSDSESEPSFFTDNSRPAELIFPNPGRNRRRNTVPLPEDSDPFYYAGLRRHRAGTDQLPTSTARGPKLIDLASKVMDNILLIDKVAENLPAGSLKDLRRACDFWSSSFGMQLRKKHSPVQLCTYTEPGKPHNLGNFLELLQSSLDLPFTRYQIHLTDKDDTTVERKCFWGFLTDFGNNITSLELKWFGEIVLETSELRRIIYELTPNLKELILDPNFDNVKEPKQESSPKNLPNLRRLKVTTGQWIFPPRSWRRPGDEFLPLGPFTQLMSDVIRSSHRLECLDLIECDTDVEFLGRIFRGLQDTDLSRVYNLKRLTTGQVTNGNVQTLIDWSSNTKRGKRLQLSSFGTDVDWSGGEEAVEGQHQQICRFLETQSANLRELTVTFDEWIPAACRLPRMRHLKKLNLWDRCGLLAAQIQFEGSFEYNFPQLKQFWYHYEVRDTDVRAAAVPQPFHPGVEALKLEISRAAAYKVFVNFWAIFPALHRLELSFGTEPENNERENAEKGFNIQIDTMSFAQVWSTWSALTVLRITWNVDYLGLNLDEWVSGVPRHEFDYLIAELDFQNITLETLCSTVDKYKDRAGISDLEYLREFTLSSSRFNRNVPQLTDLGGYCGIALASSSLQRVVVYGNGKNLVTERCLSFTRQTLGPTVLISL